VVEELVNGSKVINQPAGHVRPTGSDPSMTSGFQAA
jgi:hypothetical protein